MKRTDFTVNSSAKMTEMVENIIKTTDWEEMRRKNQPAISQFMEFLSYLPGISAEQYADSMHSLNTYKDIATYVFPDKARFKFFKRIIRRFMRVSTSYQQVFNNALLGVLQNIISDLHKLGVNQTSMVNHFETQVESQRQEIETLTDLTNRSIETENANRESLNELQNKVDQDLSEIKNRFELLKDSGVDLFSDNELKWNKNSYSQAGEDNILVYIFEMLRIPLDQCDYVDLGANHPRSLSNTYRFYNAGARGILVEANPKLANELRFYRHRDIVLNRFVSSNSGQTMDFYILNGDGLSTSDYTAAQEFIKESPWLKIEEKVRVESIGINEIFEYLGHAPKILNIDVEGMEAEILNGIDWKKYRPLVIIVEMIPYRKTLYVGEKNKEILELMDKNGYIEYAYTGINSIFIDKESTKELHQ